MSTYRDCDGVRRRDFVLAGTLAGLGWNLASELRRAAAAEKPGSGATAGGTPKSAIFVFLGGGPTHIDTFDPKPEAPDEIRGEFKPIATNVAGIQLSEYLPRLAQCADKFSIVRGVSHTLAGHELGTSYLNTGSRPVPSLIYPGYGAVVSRELTGAPELPHYVAIPGTAHSAGYLGVRHAPLQTGEVPRAGQPFSVRGVSVGDRQSAELFEKRQKLLSRLDGGVSDVASDSKLLDGLDRFGQQAYDMLRSPQAKSAFDTSLETPETVARFGEHKFGMSCLLATRLVQSGVRYASVSFGGWDTHANNFKQCKESLLPQLDQGLAALFTTLADRGLLDTTAVFVTGEFGRTPKINEKSGRDHWPRAMFTLLSGCGMRRGQVFGASDDKGMGPANEPITPDQVAASFYHALGIDYRKEYHTTTGRPVTIVREGSLIPGLFA